MRASTALYRSFREIHGFLLGAVGIAASLLLWIYPANASISLKWALPAGVLFAVALVVLANALFNALNDAEHGLPVVIARVDVPAIYGDLHCVLLLEPSRLFSHDVIVAVYMLDEDGFERLVGMGRVLTIQQDGKIQVGIQYVEEPMQEHFERVAANPTKLRKDVVVKPAVPRSIVTLLRSEARADD